MNCKIAIRLIHLYKEGELNKKEKLLLNNHLSTCHKCMSIKRDLHLYEDLVNDVVVSEPYMPDHKQVVTNIFEGIKLSESNTMDTVAGMFRIPVIRLVASVLIFLQAGMFTYQYLFFKAYSQTNQRHDPIAYINSAGVNNACIEESKKIIIDILGYEDAELKRKAINYRRNLTGTEIEEYAAKVCQYSGQIQRATGRKKKKDLLISLINNELNIKL